MSAREAVKGLVESLLEEEGEITEAEGSITFDKSKLTALTKAYDKAVASGDDQFMFEGNVLLTSYARYLVTYLNSKIGGSRYDRK